jgi:uncharacterized protein YkwD
MKTKTLKSRILIFLLTGFIMALACSSEEKTDTTDDQGTGDAISTMETEVLTAINAYRATKSLPALVKETVIATEARKHSTNMAAGTVPYGHDGLSTRLSTIRQTITLSEGAENVGAGTNNTQLMVNTWIASSAHKANIEYSYTKTGIGIAKAGDGTYYYTQIFIKP